MKSTVNDILSNKYSNDKNINHLRVLNNYSMVNFQSISQD